MTALRPTQPRKLWLVILLLAATPVGAADYGAVASGNWNAPATWTGGTAVPGAADAAYIGSTTPSGSAAAATVTLTANQSISSVFLGNGNGTAGTLNLGTSQLTVGNTLYLGFSGTGTGTVVRGAGGSFTARVVNMIGTGSSLTFGAADVVSDNLSVQGGATATTAAAGNVIGNVLVQANNVSASKLTLGAALNVSSLDVNSGAILSAQNQPITAGFVGFGYTGIVAAPADVRSRGTLTTNTLYLGANTGLTFTAADRVTQTLYSAGGGTVTTADTANIASGASVTMAGGTNRLKLGAALDLGGGSLSVYAGATLDTQSQPITAGTVNLGTLGAGAVTVQNLSTLTASGAVSLGNGTQATLGAGNSSAGSLNLAGGSVLAVRNPSGPAGQLTVTGSGVAALTIDATSKLRFDLNGLTQGAVLRWANPAGGDHVSDLTSLISAGKIDFVVTNGGTYQLTTDANYTSIVQPVPEPGSMALVGTGALGIGAFVRRRWRSA